MARLARVVVPGLPHHVTQRGNGRQQTFFSDGDYRLYRGLLGEHCRACNVAVWSWVLMPNHVHLILVPKDEDGLRRALSQVHRRYAGEIHARMKRTGHFWQGRFGCVAMDEDHLAAAIRYVLMNPVRAGLAARAVDWRWSSARALLGIEPDPITACTPVQERWPDLAELLESAEDEERTRRLREAESVGRPIGGEAWLRRLEEQCGRSMKRGKPGRKRRELSALSP
ncbi:MAG TPA: transposase [Sphingomicrobium sp.]|nr:transposase [Sphingomicrobium sp.]